MSEPIIYFAIGFLLAVTLAFAAKPFALSRMGRAAIKRLESTAPNFVAGIESDMGELHAQIAVATRRLELSVEQMKAKTTSQLTEIGKSHEAIALLKTEYSERWASVTALEAKEKQRYEELRTIETALAAKTGALQEVERRLGEEKAALSDVLAMIHAQDKLAETERQHEAEVEKLSAERTTLAAQLAQSQEECTTLRNDMTILRRQVEAIWASERMANAVLRERITDVAGEVVRVAHALEGLGSPIELMLAGKAADAGVALEPPELTAVNGNNLIPPVATDTEESKGALAHRLRSAQLRASRVSSPGGT
jgi:hypothetical protein